MIEDAASFDDDEEDYGEYQVCVWGVCVGVWVCGCGVCVWEGVFPWKYVIIWY